MQALGIVTKPKSITSTRFIRVIGASLSEPHNRVPQCAQCLYCIIPSEARSLLGVQSNYTHFLVAFSIPWHTDKHVQGNDLPDTRFYHSSNYASQTNLVQTFAVDSTALEPKLTISKEHRHYGNNNATL